MKDLQEYQDQEPVSNELTWQEVLLFAALAIGLLYLGYRGVKYLAGSAPAVVPAKAKAATVATALTVSEIASRLKY